MRTVLVSLAMTALVGCATSPPVAASAVSEAEACAMPDIDLGNDQRSIAGAALLPCGTTLRTGFHRDGRCTTGPEDHGVHVVCAEVTEAFLSFTSSQGNDLSTPRGAFPGLHPGDAWCLCASRWAEANEAGVAPPVVLEATHERALAFIPRAALEAHARR